MKMWIPIVLTALSVVGCAGGPPPKPVYLNRDVTSVAVLPPFSEVIDPEAWKTMWPQIIEELAARGYRVVPAQRVDAFYAKNRFHGDPAEISVYSPVELANEFDVDSVFYSNITRWSYEYVFLFSTYGVEADYELVDGKTEERLWAGHGSAVHTETLGGRNGGEFLASIFMVAGNAFLNRIAPYSGECVEGAFRRLPHAGYDPELPLEIEGTKPPDSQSDKEAPGKQAEEPPVTKEIPDP